MKNGIAVANDGGHNLGQTKESDNLMDYR